MATVTISKKEYRELKQLKARLDKLLSSISTKRRATTGEDLLRLAKLKIKGGPKNLSQKADSYLYDR